MVRGREVSSREVVQAHLDRVEAVNPHLNAIVRLLPEQALAAADEADRLAADGTWLGPLHGVPFTVKENIDLAGTPTTQGSPALAEAISPVDAPPVERLRAAGGGPGGRAGDGAGVSGSGVCCQRHVHGGQRMQARGRKVRQLQ